MPDILCKDHTWTLAAVQREVEVLGYLQHHVQCECVRVDKNAVFFTLKGLSVSDNQSKKFKGGLPSCVRVQACTGHTLRVRCQVPGVVALVPA